MKEPYVTHGIALQQGAIGSLPLARPVMLCVPSAAAVAAAVATG
jgi:hypothetical protein